MYEPPIGPVRGQRRVTRALARLNDIADISVDGAEHSDEFGQHAFRFEKQVIFNARITGGGRHGLYSGEEVVLDTDGRTWVPTGQRPFSADSYPLVERNRSPNVAAGQIVDARLDEATGRAIFTEPLLSRFFPALISAPVLKDGCWLSDWVEAISAGTCQMIALEGGRQGLVGGFANATRVAFAGGLFHEVWRVQVSATGGTFNLIADHVAVNGIAHDGSDLQAKLDAALGAGAVTVTEAPTCGYSGHVFTLLFRDQSHFHELATSSTDLLPKGAQPAHEANNHVIGDPTCLGGQYFAYVTLARSTFPEILITGGDAPGSWRIEIVDALAGTFKLSVDGQPTDDLSFDATAADVAAALNALGLGTWAVTGSGTNSDPFIATVSPASPLPIVDANDNTLIGAGEATFQNDTNTPPRDIITCQCVNGRLVRSWQQASTCNSSLSCWAILESIEQCCPQPPIYADDQGPPQNGCDPATYVPPPFMAMDFQAGGQYVLSGCSGTPPCLSLVDTVKCGDGTIGEVWSGHRPNGQAIALVKCGDLFCVDVGDGILKCQPSPNRAGCAIPLFDVLLPEIVCGGGVTAVTFVAGSSCAMACWRNNATGQQYCSASDLSATHTPVGPPSPDCASGCPPVWTCWQSTVLSPGVSGYRFCGQGDYTQNATLVQAGYPASGNCQAACVAYFCIEWLVYNGQGGSPVESLGTECKAVWEQGFVDIGGGQFKKAQILEGPFSASNCNGAC